MDNLKPCPFCGAEAIFGGSDNVNGHPYWYVYCHECGATVNGNEDAGKAIEAWNRRVNDWYRPEARNRCPTTCAQYRDGWNDAMNYIFRDGKGYRPYRRDKEYGE